MQCMEMINGYSGAVGTSGCDNTSNQCMNGCFTGCSCNGFCYRDPEFCLVNISFICGINCICGLNH